MTPKLAFVDHSFHANTRSGDFLRTLFSQHYEVVDFWDDGWKGGKTVTATEVNASGAGVVFFFQSLMSLAELRKLTGRIVWAPMYDSVPLHNPAYWLELATIPMKIVTFSTTLHYFLQQRSLDSLLVQYWFDPATLPQVTDYSGVRLFFWQRTDITFDHIKQLLGDTPVEKCVIKLNPDPAFAASKPSAEDMERYHIELVEAGFTEKSDYLNLLQSCNVFICPRRYEGIGMSFLEAMAMGLVPVGLNFPTMNEYITDGKNGLLWNKPTQLDFSKLHVLGNAVHTSATEGYEKWQAQQSELLNFMTSTLQTTRGYTLGIKLQSQIWRIGYLVYLVKRKFFGGTY